MTGASPPCCCAICERPGALFVPEGCAGLRLCADCAAAEVLVRAFVEGCVGRAAAEEVMRAWRPEPAR